MDRKKIRRKVNRRKKNVSDISRYAFRKRKMTVYYIGLNNGKSHPALPLTCKVALGRPSFFRRFILLFESLCFIRDGKQSPRRDLGTDCFSFETKRNLVIASSVCRKWREAFYSELYKKIDLAENRVGNEVKSTLLQSPFSPGCFTRDLTVDSTFANEDTCSHVLGVFVWVVDPSQQQKLEIYS